MRPLPINIQPIIGACLNTLSNAHLRAGAYARWLGAERTKRPDGAKLNPYGCADAANILYTLGHFPSDLEERAEWIDVLRGFQDPATGLFNEETHHTYHVTAHCVAALELFDAKPRHRLSGLDFLEETHRLETFLASLAWVEHPWQASHQGAGIFAARWITQEATPEWVENYFEWLWEAQDATTGFWKKDCITGEKSAPLFHHLAGSFHYLFNHEAARQPLRYPEAMVDTCLRIRQEAQWPQLARSVGFSDIDWVYCLTRALRQSGHRHEEAKKHLKEFAKELTDYLFARIATTEVPFDDLHTLFGTLCALAELQLAVPGLLRSERPLRLVLDRRPFI